MKIKLKVITNIEDLKFDSFEARTKDGETILITWDETEVIRDKENFIQYHVFRGVSYKYKYENYTNGKIDDFLDLDFTDCTIYSDQDDIENDTILIHSITIEDYDAVRYTNINLIYSDKIPIAPKRRLISLMEAYKLKILPGYIKRIIDNSTINAIRKSLKKIYNKGEK